MGMLLLRFSSFSRRTILLLILKVTFLGSNWSLSPLGIVSKSYECRLKGQGATFVETDSPFTAAALAEESPVKDRPLRSSRRPAAPPEPVQQVIIIQGYEGEFALDASVEETAAATLQTLALAGQVARVVHITEDAG